MPEFPYSRLRRWPDVEADNLQAYDATDLLLVERALAISTDAGITGAEIAVIGDEYGAITLALIDAGLRGIRVHQDLATGRRALARNAEELGLDGSHAHELDTALLDGARLVLLQLPKSLAELEQIADAVARWAAPDVQLVAGGRVKHMTLAQNEVLAGRFAHVQAQRAERKSRLIVAAEPSPVPDEPPFPVVVQHEGFTLAAFGGAFAGARIDIGTRVLLDVLGSGALRQAQGPRAERPGGGSGALRQAQGPRLAGPRVEGPGSEEWVAEPVEASPTVVDLGCGTGALAVSFALAHPTARVIATDRSAAAVASARATVAANGLTERITVTHDDAASELETASADVVLLNPPFHLGASVHTGAATRLFEAAARLLRPGGELFTVYNSSLGYRAELSRLIGATEQLHRTPKFTVTRSIRRG
ncbi:class I SAM-dependent methyltransferase [Microbacterium oxydans]|uniref:Ribosomal RNA large subunit methyltransferase G n=1 Tax=Microbacterium oxydans TaxID=82380 RepID=A0A0F0LFZ2_9MICO|nr:methyltransferase [Microbacterium oxydans]KJL32058.1 Ribosomal RNA large subunit methyltransferase G [Microbacterium oxydans]